MGGSVKINRLLEGEGSGTDAKRDAADPIKQFAWTMPMTSARERSPLRSRRELLEEIAPANVDLGCGDDSGHAQ